MNFQDLFKKLVSRKKAIWHIYIKYVTSIFTGYKSLPLQLILVIFCHMDYSENLTQQYNYKLSSSHFNKKQYSLHCIVTHPKEGSFWYFIPFQMIKNMIIHSLPQLLTIFWTYIQASDICLKLDNCWTQYKCKFVFKQWQFFCRGIM